LSDKTPEEIRRIANLGNVASEAITEFMAVTPSTGSEKKVPGAKPAIQQQASDNKETIETIPDKTDNIEDQSVTEYQKLLSRALKHQALSDSLMELAIAARVKVRNLDDPDERWQIQKQIMLWEKNSAEERGASELIFERISSSRSNVVPETIEIDTVINEMIVYKYSAADSISEKAKTSLKVPDESEKGEIREDGKAGVKASVTASGPAGDVGRITDELIEFSILDASPYSAENPVPADIKIPAGTFYRIQLGVFSRQVEPETFNGFYPITLETIPGRNLYKYYAGTFRKYQDARQALSSIKTGGYPDAFIVAWYDGSVISNERAQKLEKPSGN
jgi:hypothetical protein